MVQNPIKIAGAGPSGLTAAICLAKVGWPVEVFEARDTVGGRFIGDFQVIENAGYAEDALDNLKRMGVALNFFVEGITEATFYDQGDRGKTVHSQKPFSYLIKRGGGADSLDTCLLSQAREAGAKVYFKHRVSQDDVDIVATGPAVADGLAKEMTFETTTADTTSVLFDMSVSPGGYSYLFVRQGKATFGCAITRDFDHIRDYFDRALARFQGISAFDIKSPQYAFSYMNFCLKSNASAEGKAFVGEAGGFQDYLFGLGIRYAMKTGFSAAQSIIKKKPYDQLWKEEVGSLQNVSLVNRFLYEKGGNLGLSSFVNRAAKRDLRDYLGKWHEDNAWKRLLLPWIKRSWTREKTCFHRLPEHWCRKKPESEHAVALGKTEDR